jgi:hypothetical protein
VRKSVRRPVDAAGLKFFYRIRAFWDFFTVKSESNTARKSVETVEKLRG